MVDERLKVDWTSVNRTAFIDAMIEVQESGFKTDSGFCSVDIDCGLNNSGFGWNSDL